MLWQPVYGLATRLALPFVLLYFFWRGRHEPAYRRHWGERLGFGARLPRGAIWIHAASVGEVVLVALLVRRLRERHPDVPLLVTTFTPTGRERARTAFGDGAHYRYVALDTPGATRRFVRRVGPLLGVFAETELWPNLITAAHGAGVPIALVNASVSERSAARYAARVLAAATRSTLRRVAAIGAASEAHAQRFINLGAPRERVVVTGNLKYDNAVPEAAGDAGRALRHTWQAEARAVWMAASTHDGEEAPILEAFRELRNARDDVLLVIAPRHPQRFDAVADLLAESGWRIARRSRGEPVDDSVDIVFADTLGEVPMFYAASDVVFVGGSLVPGIGGHNVIEAAALNRPFCVGPHIGEWRDVVAAFQNCGAARVCDTPEALAAAVREWLDAPQRAQADGRAGKALARASSGALERTLALVERLMG